MKEIDIISGCKTGNRLAQRAFVDNYSSYLYGICRRYAYDKPSANDCLQDALVQVLTKISKYDDRGNFKAWIARVTVTKCLEHIRKAKRHQSSEILPEYEPSSAAAVTYQLELEEVMQFMSTLPHNARVALNMYLVEGYSHKEIGEHLGVTESSSRSLVARARQKIQQQFESERLSIVHKKAIKPILTDNEHVPDQGTALK